MAFAVPTLDEMTALLVKDFSNRFPDDDVSRTSDNWKRLRVLALAVTSLHAHARQVDRDAMPDTASETGLGRWGDILDLGRKGATASYKADALRVTGANGSTVTLGDELTYNGLTFQANETVTLDSSGFADIDILAIDTGAQTRLSEGTTLAFVSAPIGIDPTAVLVKDIDEGGLDQEEEGAWRDRILSKLAQPEAGGKASDYRAWARAVSFVDEAYVWACRGGLGTVHVACLKNGEGTARLLNVDEIAEVQAYIDERRPVAQAGDLVLTVEADPQDVEITYKPSASDLARTDWDDTGVAWSVVSWNAGTRTLKLAHDRPADMDVGDRLIYVSQAAPYSTGEEAVIESFGGADDEVVLAASTNLTDAPPVAGDPVYAGGPLCEPIRQAVKDHINSLGPRREDDNEIDDFSEGSTYWEGTLDRSTLQAVARGAHAEIRSADVEQPTSNYAPINSAPDATVYVVTPRMIVARRQ